MAYRAKQVVVGSSNASLTLLHARCARRRALLSSPATSHHYDTVVCSESAFIAFTSS